MSGRYGQYARLRPSGEQWLGDIPTDWQAERLKTLFKIRKNIAGRLGFDVLSVTQKGLKQKDGYDRDTSGSRRWASHCPVGTKPLPLAGPLPRTVPAAHQRFDWERPLYERAQQLERARREERQSRQ